MSKNLFLPSAASILNVRDYLGAYTPPSSNTGGNFSLRAKKTDLTAQAKVCIDYLTVSYPASAFDVPFPEFEGEESLEQSRARARAEWLKNVCKHVNTWTDLDCINVLDTGRGFLGFSESAKIVVQKNNGDSEQIGVIAWGGHSQNGRVMLSLSGVGTSLIEKWHLLAEWIQSTSGKITRLDLAADFMNGEYTIQDMINDYEQGNFKAAAGGGNPSAKLICDMGSNEGNTLNVGKRENGKMLRGYEKGKQLGDKSSQWFRLEGEIHNKDRVIPVDALINPESYYAGLNPVCARLIAVAASQIKTAKKVVEATLSSLSHYASVGYGKLINSLMQITNDNHEAVINFLIREGVPRRLRSPLVAVGFLDSLEVAVYGRSLALTPQV
jgi:phage replication initiation protein